MYVIKIKMGDLIIESDPTPNQNPFSSVVNDFMALHVGGEIVYLPMEQIKNSIIRVRKLN